MLHIALACYRAAVPRAIEHLYTWLRDHVMPLPLSECRSESELRSLYAALGADSSALDLLSASMRLFWDSRRQCLQIHDEFLKQEHSLEHLSAVL